MPPFCLSSQPIFTAICLRYYGFRAQYASDDQFYKEYPISFQFWPLPVAKSGLAPEHAQLGHYPWPNYHRIRSPRFGNGHLLNCPGRTTSSSSTGRIPAHAPLVCTESLRARLESRRSVAPRYRAQCPATGKAVTNFQLLCLPAAVGSCAPNCSEDPYFFDFLTLEKPFHERELETGLLRHLQDFLVELGTGFASSGHRGPHGSRRR